MSQNEMQKLWEVDDRLGRQLGIGGHFVDVPAYQIINDVNSKARWIVSVTSNCEFRIEETGKLYLAHPDWLKANSWLTEKFRALGDIRNNAVRAVKIYNELIEFVETKLFDIISEVEGNEGLLYYFGQVTAAQTNPIPIMKFIK